METISYRSSFRELHKYLNLYNDTQTELSGKIRQGIADTAKEIVRIYIQYLNREINRGRLNTTALPPLSTNNVQLAKLGLASPRTIQRHIKRLQQAGLITRKIWHGSHYNFELFINPKILLITHSYHQAAAKKPQFTIVKECTEEQQEVEILSKSSSSCPHSDTVNSKNNLLIAVHKLHNKLTVTGKNDSSDGYSGDEKNRCSLALTTKKNLSGYTGENGWKGIQEDTSQHTPTTVANNSIGKKLTGYAGEKEKENCEKTGENGGKTRAVNSNRLPSATSEETARAAFLNYYTNMLWMLAKQVLYCNIYLTEFQEKEGLRLIRKWYEPVETAKFSVIHQAYVERISMARKYVEKDPANRFVQLPNRYFDTNNPHGFTGTKKWHKAHRKCKKEVRNKLILHAQIRRFKENLGKEPCRQKPPLQLFREGVKRIESLGHPPLLDEFHAAIADYQAVLQ